jgi:hypothetical protein
MRELQIALLAVGTILFGIGFTAATSAQTPTPVPGDIILQPDSETGQYSMKVEIPTQDTEDVQVNAACCYRVDLAPIQDLGCGPRDALNQVIAFAVDIVETPGDDGEVRCNTVNATDQSAASHNAYIIPFPLPRPNAPTVR